MYLVLDVLEIFPSIKDIHFRITTASLRKHLQRLFILINILQFKFMVNFIRNTHMHVSSDCTSE